MEKYSDFNLLHIKDFSNLKTDFLASNMFWTSFLWEKKLIIIDLNNDIDSNLSDFFINNLQNIPETNIVLFNYFEPDKRLKLYKEIDKQAIKKEFNQKDANDTYWIIQNKYSGKISAKAINLIISYKANNLEKIVQEIEKLLILHDFIDEKEITENIVPELEQSIFILIDDILNLKINYALENIKIITTQMNIYAFYNNLLANLRTNVFISKLKNEKKPNLEINQILSLWNKSFLTNKNYKISYSKLKNLYINLIDLDKKMKSWKMLGSEDKDFLLEIENVLLKELKT